MRSLLILTGLFTMAACAPMAAPIPPGGGAWQCNAQGAQSLIGTHFAAVTFPQDANVRFVCSTCAMTRDYNPNRLTVIYDEPTGIIREVRCV